MTYALPGRAMFALAALGVTLAVGWATHTSHTAVYETVEGDQTWLSYLPSPGEDVDLVLGA